MIAARSIGGYLARYFSKGRRLKPQEMIDLGDLKFESVMSTNIQGIAFETAIQYDMRRLNVP